jgi:hypothetical protein
MGLGEIFVVFFLLSNIRHLFFILKNKNRKQIVKHNMKLHEYRKIPVKTVEQQKEFIKLKYPESKFKWNWSILPKLLLNIGFFIIIYKILIEIEKYFGFTISIWVGITIFIVGSFLVNFVLKKLGLNRNVGMEVIFK